MIRLKEAVLLFTICFGVCAAYKLGVGRADCTGPSVEVTFMGYAQLSQKGKGIHTRQFARAFIIEDNGKRVVYVSVDAGMMGHTVKRNVLRELTRKYGSELYKYDNVIISGTHTHSTPGGFLTYLLYDISCLGFVSETFNALVKGITQSVIRAHNNMRDGQIYLSQTEVDNANINRSPAAYDNNPEEEKNLYPHNTDRTITQMRFVDKSGEVFGAINWFAVHPTSMNNTNKLISSDNVGLASILLEMEVNQNPIPGKGEFVGAVAATNLGDVSPNIMGPKCQRTGNPCDPLTSSCPKGDGFCVSSGPGKDIFESTKIIGTRIFEKAWKLLKDPRGGRLIEGPIAFVHQFVDMPNSKTTYLNPNTGKIENVRGCLPAMGYSFAAGTTDGPGAFDFEQGTITDNPLWNAVRDFIAEPTADDIECQKPKPILLATGRAQFPYKWQPTIVPTQVVLIGDLVLAAVPGEFTTMSGRRLKSRIIEAVLQKGGNVKDVIVAGLSNMYTSYIATPEEYLVQRYEGASTIFGPHTLTIYLEQYSKLIKAIYDQTPLEGGPLPPDEDDKQISLQPPVIYDGHPLGWDFGYVRVDPLNSYRRGDTVYVKFVSGNPRNNLMSEKSYFYVEQKQQDGNWTVVATDANWETQFRWQRTSTIFGFSDIEFMWQIPYGTPAGSYRIRHFGYYRYILGGTYPYSGSTKTFVVDG